MIDYYVCVIIRYSESIPSPTHHRVHSNVRVREYTLTLPNKFPLITNTILTCYTRGYTHEWFCVCLFG